MLIDYDNQDGLMEEERSTSNLGRTADLLVLVERGNGVFMRMTQHEFIVAKKPTRILLAY